MLLISRGDFLQYFPNLTVAMSFLRTVRLFLFCFFVFLHANQLCYSQSLSYPLKEWVKKLAANRGPTISVVQEVLSALNGRDSLQAISVLNELEKKGSSEGEYFVARFNFLKAAWLWNIRRGSPKESIKQHMKKALNAAYETDNDSLVSTLSWEYGSMMYYAGETEPATMYCLYSTEINERIGRQMNGDQYRLLGDILYSTRDYEKSIYYTRLAIQKESDTSLRVKEIVMSRYNTIALCWQKMGYYDSAFFISISR